MKTTMTPNGLIQEPLTQAEIDELALINQKEEETKTAKETAKQSKEADQASGNQKLLDLGLTQAEATALTGYTPPVAE